ncbi:MAG: hypothetical protein P1U84_04950 [Parvibaculaceae bacterium]|nr:hypothetical protein [Parvibaculaceae bacterium]
MPLSMDLTQIKALLPAYCIARMRYGKCEIRFEVPKRLRPEGWPATIVLPRNAQKRTGNGDLDEVVAAIEDGKALKVDLDLARRGQSVDTTPPGSIPSLVQIYKADKNDDLGYRALAKTTKAGYDIYLDALVAFSQEAADKDRSNPHNIHPHIKHLSGPHIRGLLARYADRPRTQSLMRNTLSTIFQVAIAEGHITDNPVGPNVMKKKRIKRRKKTLEQVLWTEDQQQKHFNACLEMGYVGLYLALNFTRWQAHRLVDGTLLHRSWFEGLPAEAEWMGFTVHKTSVRVRIPVSTEFRKAIVRAERTGLVGLGEMCLNPKNGKPYFDPVREDVTRAFSKQFNEARAHAGLPKSLEARHLRHTAIIEMARAGLSIHQIRSRTAHSLNTIVTVIEHYLPVDEQIALEATLQLEDWRDKNRA